MAGGLPQFVRRVLGKPGARSLAVQQAVAADARAVLSGSTATDPRAQELADIARAAERTLGLAPFDAQLVAAQALLDGITIEMDTGEGKTLVGAMAAAAFARAGRRVHVLTVNDYLAVRDATAMGPLFAALGVAVASVTTAVTPDEHRAAYTADVVYAAASEVGFDLLRDRFAVHPAERVNPVFDVAIIDEVDAVLIDDAMIPLVLAGQFGRVEADVLAADRIARDLDPKRDLEIDDERLNVTLSDAGIDRVEAALGGINLYDGHNAEHLTRISIAAHAHTLVQRDVDYIVSDGRVQLINTARGRVATLQRWPDGLHAAVEAKEGLELTAAGEVMDSITFGELVQSYALTVGMSGSVLSVADELLERYDLPTARVERTVATRRVDHDERILVDEAEKDAAIVAEVAARHRSGQPILLGTQSVAESERLADLLEAVGITARVLNAKNDAAEAEVIARAGEIGAVTISTQMAGRGTDIRLGGPDERDRAAAQALGGLIVIATARYPSPRLDLQLRGRAGRQDDPGETVGFESLDGTLMTTAATPGERHRALAGSTPARAKALDRAQRILAGQRLERQLATISYHRAQRQQRDAVLRHRAAHESDDDPVLREAALLVYDDLWRDHLAMLAELRDGIHLRALAGQDPRAVFHSEALRRFDGLFDRAEAEIARIAAAQDPATASPRRRPSATWTYMVTDNPLGSPGDRLVRGLARKLRPEG